MPWLGTLAEFDFYHFDLRQLGIVSKFPFVGSAIVVKAPTLAGANIPNQIASINRMGLGDGTFTRVVRKTTLLCAFIERQNRIR